MKRSLAVVLLLSLSIACKKAETAKAPTASPPPAAAGSATTPAANGGAPGGLPGAPAANVKPIPAQLPAVVAKVDGDPIERWELESALRTVEARAGVPVPADKRDEVLRGLLDQLVAYHVLAQESRTRKLAVSDADVKERIGHMQGQFPTPEAFQQALAAQGMSVDQLQKQTRTSLQIDKLIDSEINPKVAVQDADVQTFYQQNADHFKQGETVHASHILIAVPQHADPTQKQQARTRADQVLKQVRAGGDFAKLAREQSQDPGSAPNGGDLGFFAKGQMDPAFETAAFALKPGAMSGVVESSFGYHIIKLQERRPPRVAPLTEVGGQIKEFLTEQQRQTKISEFVEQAKTKMKIELLV